jgi:hypothetical protein
MVKEVFYNGEDINMFEDIHVENGNIIKFVKVVKKVKKVFYNEKSTRRREDYRSFRNNRKKTQSFGLPPWGDSWKLDLDVVFT